MFNFVVKTKVANTTENFEQLEKLKLLNFH